MNESKITRDIMQLAYTYLVTHRLFRKHIQMFKLSDRFTRGVPDLIVCLDGRTTYFEFKLADNKQIFEPIQIAIMKRLVRAHLVVWDIKTKCGIAVPNECFSALSKKSAVCCDLKKDDLVLHIVNLCLR